MYQNAIYICISGHSKICWFPVKKMLMPAELKGFVTWFIYFLDLLWLRYNCAKFHHCKICVPDFMEGESFCPHPPSVSSPEKAHSELGPSIYFSALFWFALTFNLLVTVYVVSCNCRSPIFFWCHRVKNKNPILCKLFWPSSVIDN